MKKTKQLNPTVESYHRFPLTTAIVTKIQSTSLITINKLASLMLLIKKSG
jgi:flagellar biosynthesis GTPase FlhF